MQSIGEGRFGPEHVAAELGEVAAGLKPGRTSDDQVTLFKSLGLAVEDVTAAGLAYRRAVESGRGLAAGTLKRPRPPHYRLGTETVILRNFSRRVVALDVEGTGLSFVGIECAAGDAFDLLMIDDGDAVVDDGDIAADEGDVEGLPLAGSARNSLGVMRP